MKIKSAEEIMSTFDIELLLNHNILTKVDILIAMKEYAAQFIELAAEKASIIEVGPQDDWGVDKKSILKLKEQIK